jgi:hypothetical protein
MAVNDRVPSVDVRFYVSSPRESAIEILEALGVHKRDETMSTVPLDVQPVTGGITNTLFKCTVRHAL